MKAATGELNLTVITIVAIGLVAALFYFTLWPSIKESITSGWENTNENAPTSYIEKVEVELL
jgi:hypothetical protein